MAELILKFLGVPELRLRGEVLETDRRKAIALLAYLALEDKRHSRESLAAFFWSEYDQGSALAYLRRTLWELNQMLGNEWIDVNRDNVKFNHTNCWIDVTVLLDSIKSENPVNAENLSQLIAAAAIFRGNFLEGFTLRDAPAFDDWQLFQAETLRQAYSSLLSEICQVADSQENGDELITHARQWVNVDPLNETAQRALISAYAKYDLRNMALRQYQELVKLLKSELGTNPEPDTIRLFKQIRDDQYPPAEAQSHPSSTESASSIPGDRAGYANFPQYPDRFIGRETDQQKIIEMFTNATCRLLTILGPGGIGKTRLAVESGRQFISQRRDGVFFIPLAAISQPDQLPMVIANSIGCVIRTEESPDNPLKSPKQQLLDYLTNRRLLLILDNFEQIVSSAELLSDILTAGEQVHILVTSRIRLQLEEEWVLPLEGLEINHQDQAQSGAIHPAAIELFLERSRRFSPGMQFSQQDRQLAAQICELVAGVPLGIELAAAWTRSLSLDEIKEEISRSLDFLHSSARNIPEKHQSMRAVFESSWNLLSHEEQLAFSRLSLFKGSFDRAAAQAALGASLTLLTQLADHSLIRRLDSGRYEIHELLRQFAYGKLVESPERQEIEDQFCAYFLDELSIRFGDLIGNRISQGLAQIDREFETIRLAWQLGVESGMWEHLKDAFVPLFLYLRMRGYVYDAWKLFEAAVVRLAKLPQDQPFAVQTLSAYVQAAQAVYCQIFAHRQEPMQYRCEELVEQAYAALIILPTQRDRHIAALIMDFGMGMLPNEISLEQIQLARNYFQQTGQSWESGLADFARGEFAVYIERDFTSGEEYYQQSLETFTSLGSIWYQMLSLKGLSAVALSTGRYHLALQYAEQCLKIIQEMDLTWETLDVQLTLGRIEVALGHYQRAVDYYRGNLKALENMGDVWYIAVHYDCLGYAYTLMGKLEPAQNCYDTSLAIYRKSGDKHGIGMALSNLGDLARAKNDPHLAINYYQEGFQYLESVNGLWGMAVALKKIGQVEWQLGNRKSAITSLFQALKLAVQMERDPEILEVLTALIAYYYQAGYVEHAEALIELVESHPATPQMVLDQLKSIVTGLEPKPQKSSVVFRSPVEAALKSLVFYEPEGG